MHTRLSLLALASAAGSAIASSSSTQPASASTLTTTFFNLGPGITPVASIIGVNATFTDIITYLIACPPSPTTPLPSPTASDTDDPNSTNPIILHRTCAIPTDGMTLVAGPATMSILYTNTHTPSVMAKSYACRITASATAAAATATATSDGYAAECDMAMVGQGADGIINIHGGMVYYEEDSPGMWGPLVVTAGVEKLAAATASSAVTGSAAATASSKKGEEASSSAASPSGSSSNGAAGGRVEGHVVGGVVGAAGLLFVALVL